ncbi:hypothetical protein MMC09_000209 [Bachmanniomyces sp. S44760]|nr:hypothetical protein [Bachmanniomyces sp. S44760]
MASRTSTKKKLTRLVPVVETRLHLLTLPFEIREYIYTEVAHNMPVALPSLLSTNRQISKEARPFVFKQTFEFDGQSEFFTWLRRMDKKNLRHVSNIRFKLHDIDPEKIVGALGKRLRQARLADNPHVTTSNPYIEACEHEIHRIGESLALLSNLKEFAFVNCQPSDPRPPPRMLLSFAKEITRRFPLIHHLCSHVDFLPIIFITKFQNLRSLTLTGYSCSPPEEVNAALASLKTLHTLSIIGPSPDLIFQQRTGYTGPRSELCITTSVLEYLPHLKHLSIHDPIDPLASVAKPRFLTPDFLRALITHHGHTLQTFRIATDYTLLSPHALQTLWSFARHSTSLHHLDIAFPLDFVPRVVHKLTDMYPCQDFDAAMKMVAESLDLGGGFKNLKHLRLFPRKSSNQRINSTLPIMKQWLQDAAEEVGLTCNFRGWNEWFQDL